MKNKILSLLAVAFGFTSMTSCIEEFNPLNSTVTADQAFNAPGAYKNFVSTITSTLVGKFTYSGSGMSQYDYGYPAFFLTRDVMGQDIALANSDSWYMSWYDCGVGLGPQYAVSQLPWTYYYGWIKNCNTVIKLAGPEPTADKVDGAGIAYAMRALFYMDLARMYAPKTYTADKNAETVPLVLETTTLSDYANNPRATNEKMWEFILSDLNKAEQYLANYERSTVYTPNQSVVYGLKARAYLVMGDWANAEKYAKQARAGYSIMTEEEYTSRETGFNTPNSSWMLGLTYKSDDPNILQNDGDCSWGSTMCLEANGSGCGYASSYGQPLLMDRRLYETIPATDFRRKCFVDFALDNLEKKADIIEGLKAYSDYPDWVYESGHNAPYQAVGGLSLKFRTAGGAIGHTNQYIGFVVAVPMMRVEEMYLIEAEAAGMQNEGNGIALLTAFAQSRDASYVYGTHQDAYGNPGTSPFLNEVWWQRRVELWGEGFATFDIKRLGKGIIRSYAKTNHLETDRWNTTTIPAWMTWCIGQTETNYNNACTKNPVPVRPDTDSPEHQW